MLTTPTLGKSIKTVGLIYLIRDGLLLKCAKLPLKSFAQKHRSWALLHDTVEDTEVTLPYLAWYFSARIVDAVDALTKRPHEPLESSMARVRANKIALWVKRADIADNTDPERVSHLDEDTRKRLAKKYSKSLRFLGVTENM